MGKFLLTDEMIANTIPHIGIDEFIILDFIDYFQELYPDVWDEIVARYGLYGDKRQYTSLCYMSQKVQRFSWKNQGLLHPHTPWSLDKEKDFREPTEVEKMRTGGAIVAIYRKRQAV